MIALIPWLAALAPTLLLIPGLVPPDLADSAPRRMRRAVLASALAAAALAVLVALALLASGRALPGFWVQLDALSVTMLLLVALLGAVVVDYSRRYLDGDPGQGRFMAWLALTLAAVLLLVVSGNLVLLALAWLGASLGLNRLLRFYPERPGARLAARKEWIFSRIADACLLGAIALAWAGFGTLGIAGIAEAMRVQGAGWAGHGMAVLLVLAALLKSAQFPAHGWLTEVMETPTPVSALLHAGIISAGGFLLLRMGEVVAASAGALDLLLLAGLLTALLGAAAMLTQSSVKVNLAWSTVAQMGFMVMQIGLGAFAAALLHIVAHALYKAHAFLSAGGVAAKPRAARPAPLPLRVLLPALAGAVALVLAVGAALGMPATEAPGPAVLGAVLVMALVPTLAASALSGGALALRGAAIALGVALAWFGLQAGALALFGGALPDATAPRSALAPILCVLAVLGFAALLVLNLARRAPVPGRVVEALYVHLLNGFYVNAALNRLLGRRAAAGGQ